MITFLVLQCCIQFTSIVQLYLKWCYWKICIRTLNSCLFWGLFSNYRHLDILWWTPLLAKLISISHYPCSTLLTQISSWNSKQQITQWKFHSETKSKLTRGVFESLLSTMAVQRNDDSGSWCWIDSCLSMEYRWGCFGLFSALSLTINFHSPVLSFGWWDPLSSTLEYEAMELQGGGKGWSKVLH